MQLVMQDRKIVEWIIVKEHRKLDNFDSGSTGQSETAM